MHKRFGWVTMTVLSAMILGAALFAPRTSLAEDTATEAARHTLDVTGQGKLTIQYDTANVTLGFTTTRDTAAGAYQDMSAAMNKVLDALHAMGIKDDDLKTGTFNLTVLYDWKDGNRKLNGYQSTNTLTVTTRALDKLPDIIQAAVDAGANEIQGVQFSVKDTDALLNQALDLAVDDARAKADRVAGRLGTQVTGVAKVTVQDQGRPPIIYNAAAGAAAPKSMAAPAPVLSGTGDYTATVSVTFELK